MNESTIYKKLHTNFKPSFLKVENESHMHKNHSQSPKGGNSHFYVEIKSSIFNNLSRLQSQRRIYKVLENEMKSFVHALRIKILN